MVTSFKVVNAIDVNHRGGSWPNACGQNYYTYGHQQAPGAAVMDGRGNMYLADNMLHKISIFNAAAYQQTTANGTSCLPSSGIKSLFGRADGWMNSVDNYTFDGAVGVIASGGQLIAKGNQRLMVWNDYQTKASGAPADFVLGKLGEGTALTQSQNTKLNGWSDHAIDSSNRLWTGGDNYDIIVYQLPLAPQSIPIARYAVEALRWSDTDTAVNATNHRPSPISFAYDQANNRIWMNDGWNNRLLGLRANQPLSNAAGAHLIIDKVIGQPNKTTFGCNNSNNAWSWTASVAPTAQSLCQPTIVKFDRLGNLYVVESTYECHGNNRIVMYPDSTLAGIESSSTIFPYPAAAKVFIAQSFTEFPINCTTGNKKPGHPTGIAFSSSNQMIVGTDGYYTPISERAANQIFFYNNPLQKDATGNYITGQLPDAVIPLPLGASGEINFDELNNLIVQDHTWPRILLINFKDEPNWLTPVNSGLNGSVSIANIAEGQILDPGSTVNISLAKFNLANQSVTVSLVKKSDGSRSTIYQGTAAQFPWSIPGNTEPADYWLATESSVTGAKNDLRSTTISGTPSDILPCVQANPSLTLSPITADLYAGESAVVTYTLINNDSATCSTSNFSVTPTLPSGFTQSPATISQSVAPGASVSGTITINVATTAVANSYTIPEVGQNASALAYQSTASLNITVLPPPCVNANPTLSLSPVSASLYAGQSTGFTYTLTNKDTTSCSTSNFTIVPTLPAGFTQNPTTISKSVAPGASVSGTFTISTPTNVLIGSYPIPETAQNTSLTPIYQATTPATIVVVQPDTTPPSVTITTPADGATLPRKGNLKVGATAADQSGIAEIKILLDNNVIKTCSGVTACSLNVSMNSVTAGTHTFTAQATDKGGPIANTASTSVTVTKP